MKPLTERDLETLGELVYNRYESSMKSHYENGVAPLDFGGSNGSHHGKTATKLVKHGFVEQRYRGLQFGERGRSTGARGSKVYRATEKGKVAWEAFCQLKKGEIIDSGPMKRKWGHMIPTTAYRPLTAAEITKRRLLCHLDMPT